MSRKTEGLPQQPNFGLLWFFSWGVSVDFGDYTVHR